VFSIKFAIVREIDKSFRHFFVEPFVIEGRVHAHCFFDDALTDFEKHLRRHFVVLRS
jgi:hypothetical protein